MSNDNKLGPTGTFHFGKLNDADEGALKIGVAKDSKGNVVISFGTQVTWIALPATKAVEFANLILKHAKAS